jgi:hypothetical protein
MDCASGFADEEIMDQRSIPQHRLGADAGAIGTEIGQGKFQSVAPAQLKIAAFAQRIPHLVKTGTEVRSDHTPKASIGDHLLELAQTNIAEALAVAAKRQHGIRTDGDIATDHAG